MQDKIEGMGIPLVGKYEGGNGPKSQKGGLKWKIMIIRKNGFYAMRLTGNDASCPRASYFQRASCRTLLRPLSVGRGASVCDRVHVHVSAWSFGCALCASRIAIFSNGGKNRSFYLSCKPL
eukprot:IDg21311t1